MIYCIINGEIDKRTAINLKKASIKIQKKVIGPKRWLVDLTNAGKPTPEARRIAREMFEAEGIGKSALFGMNPVARMIASFGIGHLKRRNVRFFNKKEEALAWLKE